MGDLSEHFDRSEFACKCGCGLDTVTSELLFNLERLRSFLRRPIVIHSGLRCPTYNAKVGGKPDSGHLDGTEADIACLDSHTRWEMKRIIYTWKLFNRLGNGDTFLHLGVSKTLPQEVEWNYP